MLWRHCIEKHDGKQQEIKMSVTGVYGNDVMLRQIAESVQISIVPWERVMSFSLL